MKQQKAQPKKPQQESTQLVQVDEGKKLTTVHSFDPLSDTKKAKQAADVLLEIVKQNNWSRKLGGSSEHLQYEAWQTVGKYYNLSVRTLEARYVEYGGIGGFEARAEVINNETGMVVGGAEAICMKDEYNWKSKPLFQLKSMAQTRSGSKALRQLLGFVIALAGFNPTPAEEMEGAYKDTREASSKAFNKEEAVETDDYAPVSPKTAQNVKETYAEAIEKSEKEELPTVEATDPYTGKSTSMLKIELSSLMHQGKVEKDFTKLNAMERDDVITALESAKS